MFDDDREHIFPISSTRAILMSVLLVLHCTSSHHFSGGCCCCLLVSLIWLSSATWHLVRKTAVEVVVEEEVYD